MREIGESFIDITEKVSVTEILCPHHEVHLRISKARQRDESSRAYHDFHQPLAIGPFRYEMTVRRYRGRHTVAPSAATASAEDIASPMPGRVVRVMAEAGHDVAAVRTRMG